MSVRNDALRRAARNSVQGKRRKPRPVKMPNYAAMNVPTLYRLAKDRGLKVTTKMRRDDLVARLVTG